MANAAVGEGILSKSECNQTEEAERLRDDVIQVSDFDPVSYDQLR
jgi:hypothetical protein